MTTIYSPSSGTYVAPPVGEEQGRARTKTVVKRVVFGIAAFVAVVGILVAVYFLFLANSSVKGVVKPVRIRENTDIKARPKLLALRGQNFSMSYDPVYASQSTSVRTTNTLEAYTYVASTVYDKRMAVAIQKLPSGGLTEESSYKMRTLYPDKYAERKAKLSDGSAAVIMSKKTTGEDKEAVLFVTHNELLATIAVVVNGGD
ncbi:MAG TPA: hypothetical protein VMR98_05660, partial [Candidatus Polarisedimenticolaceae bacterium]|nr:hypothetical protein [Candidatus Polarisedimenticolaceae bacterium]